MWYLLNTRTGEWFCEFAEAVPLDTKHKEEACEFHTWHDAENLRLNAGNFYKPFYLGPQTIGKVWAW